MLQAIRILIVFALFLLPCFTTMGHSADATSFDPTRIPVQAKGTIPIGTVIAWTSVTNPSDMEKWLDCNGQGVSQAVYPELYAVVGARVPDMRNQFLRGGTVAEVRQTAADTTRSHQHDVPAHSHTVSGTASSQSVSVGSQRVTGMAEGQRYVDAHTGLAMGYVPSGWSGIVNWENGNGDSESMHAGTVGNVKTASSSAVTGTTSGGTYHTSGGSVTGWTNSVANTTTHTGGTETAPQHMRVRYLIRALQ